MHALPPRLEIPAFESFGIRAFTTTRAAGDFNLGVEGTGARERWQSLQQALANEGAPRLASAVQVHGTKVLVHERPFDGWIRVEGADGHIVIGAGAAAVTVADCVPAFIAHTSGTVGIVHAGWRGVAGGILPQALRMFSQLGFPVSECHVHLGPSICGRCYEVGADVYRQLTGWETKRSRHVDLRALLAEQARDLGVARWTASGECTRCDNGVLFSHRAGDPQRQVACIYSGGGLTE